VQFARPSRRHQRARRPGAYRAQSRNRMWCSWPPKTLEVGGAERGLDIERGRFRVCRQHLCGTGGDGADIAGAGGKGRTGDGVGGKAGGREDRHRAHSPPRNYAWSVPLVHYSHSVSAVDAQANLSHILARRVDGIFRPTSEQGDRPGPVSACLPDGVEGMSLHAPALANGRYAVGQGTNRMHAFRRVQDQSG